MKIERLHRRDESLGQRLLLAPAVPLAGLFGAASSLRRTLYERGILESKQASIPVISVGNIAVGGAGKTPVVIEIASRLQALGVKVAVLAGGYRGKGRGARVVTRGEGPILDARDAGDEPLLIARRCPGVQVLVGPSRAELAQIAAENLHADVAILDDGFQHLGIARDLDIVVLDGSSPFGNGSLLPRGPLRELPAAMARAHLAWISKVDQGAPAVVEEAAALAESLIGEAPIRSRYRVDSIVSGDLVQAEAPESLRGKQVLILAGLARPGSFRNTLEGLGARVVGEALFSDHHAFTEREVQGALAKARGLGADFVCATEKDAMRLPPSLPGRDRIKVVRIETEIVAGSDRLDAFLDRLLSGVPDA